MPGYKSLDELNIIAALLTDIHLSHGVVFNTRALRCTLNKCKARVRQEGLSFLTKTLPRLGKAFDRALAGDVPLNASKYRFAAVSGTNLPRFLGEFFSRVLRQDGSLLPDPCVTSVRIIRQITYLFYKYELPYDDEQVQQVLAKFEKTERELSDLTDSFWNNPDPVVSTTYRYQSCNKIVTTTKTQVVRDAKKLLTELFRDFDPYDIVPAHGPGAVATKQQPWDKYVWTNVAAHITEQYPLDAYFYASLGHVCDAYREFDTLDNQSLPARVLLVPKDSRGPRLISCEPVDFQWIQGGLSRALRQLVENSELTKFNVFFSDQKPNQRGAWLGSLDGRYSTLDLNEASDRVHNDLVHLLFPEHVYTCLQACRSSSTVLPCGTEIMLRKFAPMGSSLCFPILALTIWALLTVGTPDINTRESILVYGDDVIVPTAYAENAMKLLDSFGLKINREKSCISGFFRESCGFDAFKGHEVTPLRLRTVWSSSRSPDVYSSWIAYANSFYDRGFFTTYERIVGALVSVYGPIPDANTVKQYAYTAKPDMLLALRELHEVQDKIPRRVNKSYQRLEYKVWVIKSPKLYKNQTGWQRLLRYFTESGAARKTLSARKKATESPSLALGTASPFRFDGNVPEWDIEEPFRVSTYTQRSTSMLVKRWR